MSTHNLQKKMVEVSISFLIRTLEPLESHTVETISKLVWSKNYKKLFNLGSETILHLLGKDKPKVGNLYEATSSVGKYDRGTIFTLISFEPTKTEGSYATVFTFFVDDTTFQTSFVLVNDFHLFFKVVET